MAIAALLAALLVPNGPVSADDLSTPNDHLASALAMLSTSQATNKLPAVLDANHVSVHFVQMPSSVYARYSVSRHVIEINDRWTNAETTTLAAVISHEATHAQDAVSGYLSSGGASACIDSEIRAFRTSALFWIDIYGHAGKLEPGDDLERQLNSIADREQRDPAGLDDLVRQTYSQQCGK